MPLLALAQRTPASTTRGNNSTMPTTDAQQSTRTTPALSANTHAADGSLPAITQSAGPSVRITRHSRRNSAASCVKTETTAAAAADADGEAEQMPAFQAVDVKLEQHVEGRRGSGNDLESSREGRAQPALEGSPEPVAAAPQIEMRVTRSSSKRASADASPAVSTGTLLSIPCLCGSLSDPCINCICAQRLTVFQALNSSDPPYSIRTAIGLPRASGQAMPGSLFFIL